MHTYIRQDGKKLHLLTPSERGDKYAYELKNNLRVTNDFVIKDKITKYGPTPLTKEQRAYRVGYLQARNDNSKLFKKKHSSYKNKPKHEFWLEI